MKKLLSLILSVCLISSFSITGLALDTADYELKGASVTLDGTKDQTVEISLTQAKEKNLIALEGSFSTKETEETNYVSLSEFKSPVALTGTNYSDVASGKIVYVDAALEGYAVAAGGAAMTVVYTVSKDTPAGKYTVQFNATNVQDYDFVSVKNQTYTAEITVTRNEPSVTTGYAVDLSSDAPSAGVAKGSSFNVNLDVSNTNATTFNAFYSILTYDSTKVSYTGKGTVGDYTVDTSESGKLIISRIGSDVTIGETPELTLPFKADVAGNAEFTLTKANVDVKEHAEAQDAPEAALSGSPMTVTVLETYTVTFTGGTGATGTAPTQEATAANGTFKLPANPFTYENHTFAGWNDGTATYQAEDTYTMPAKDVTFTAQWTENPAEPIVENVNGTTDDKQPDYVGTNEAASNELVVAKITGPEGYVPTYDGNPMFKVEGYDDNYYYVIPDGTYDNSKLGYSAGTAVTIAKSSDVNQTNLVDINDAQFVYNIYNDKATPTANVVERLILADTNRDKIVDTNDCATVVGDIQ